MRTHTQHSETTGPSASEPTSGTRSRGWLIPAAIGAVLALLVLGALFLGNDPEPAEAADLELALGESDALASCLAFDVATLAAAPVAFQGTATSVEGSEITMTVDRWFTNGEAANVRLIGEHTSTALIAGFDVTPGDQYLISAAGGTVNYCGYSGPVTPELLANYQAAFPAA